MAARSHTSELLALLATLSSLAAPAALMGQVTRPPLSADRPGLGDRAGVVAESVWQVELGGTIEAAVNDEFLVGSALLRTGFAGVELRVHVPSMYVRNQDQLLQLGDLGIGVKIPVELGGAWWSWAVMGTLTMPTGSQYVTANEAGAAATFIGEVELAGDAALALNTGYGFLFDDVGGGAVSLVVTPRFPFPGQEGLRMYAGYAARLRSGEDDHVVEWGLTRLEGPDRQWDLNAGYDPGSHNWFLGIGVAIRR